MGKEEIQTGNKVRKQIRGHLFILTLREMRGGRGDIGFKTLTI